MTQNTLKKTRTECDTNTTEKKRGRGRPRKVRTECDIETPVKKKRGRPPKIKTEEVKVKKKRGRPKKVSTECNSGKECNSGTECNSGKECNSGVTEIPVKKKRGRPKKVRTECDTDVKNTSNKKQDKTRTECDTEKKRGRGRPKKVSTECEEVDMSNVRTYKLLGWCNTDGCNGFLSTGDYVENHALYSTQDHSLDSTQNHAQNVMCKRCGHTLNVSDLLPQEKKGAERLSEANKKLYLDELNQSHLESMTTLHENDIPKEFLGYDAKDDEWD